MKIKHIMTEDVVTTRSDVTAMKAVEILHDRHVGSIVVVDDERKCKGIFTERDAIRLVAKNVQLNVPLREVMTKNVVTIGEDASLEEARRVIATHGIRHLPVVNHEDKLVGLLSVRSFLDELFGLNSSKCQ
jgi:CBS domain-containing protein